MAPNVAGSNPVSHPNLAMGFNRQLEVFLAMVATLITFVSCALELELSIIVSVLISLCVLLAGLVLGRRISEILLKILA